MMAAPPFTPADSPRDLMADSPRIYEAPCPSCGAPVRFASAQATHAVCAYCQSTVVREGDVLRRVGSVAELFDDHSPLRIGQTGHIDVGGERQGFTLVGRQQFRADTGVWNEWQAQLDDGRLAVLAEDNGQHVFSLPLPPNPALPDAANVQLGQRIEAYGQTHAVTARVQADLISAEGEMRNAPPHQPVQVVEARADDGSVLSWDDQDSPPQPFRGQAVELAALGIEGLGGTSRKDEGSQRFACPECGGAVVVQLTGSKSITCGHCAAIIDLQHGVGQQLHAARQRMRIQPLIALGSLGNFDGVRWQVLGFQRRTGTENAPGDDEDDETFTWDEYLLYHRERGFQFLSDSSEGWSLVQNIAGAATQRNDTALHGSSRYQLASRYTATTEYVAGEFYWPVAVGQQTQNQEFKQGDLLLTSERDQNDIVWSAGRGLTADTVAAAFDRSDEVKLFKRGDAGAPTITGRGCLIWLIVLCFGPFILFSVLNSIFGAGSERCRPNPNYNPNNYADPTAAQREICERRTSTRGGSWGGYSSGGSHK